MALDLLPEMQARPILDGAAQRAAEGWSIFTCSAVVEIVISGVLAKTTSYDIGPLIQSIEHTGWRLDTLNHAAYDKSSGHSEVRATMLFRRAG